MRGKRIVALTGGLGNQMFQYAFGRMLQDTIGGELELDTFFYRSVPYRFFSLSDYNIKYTRACEHVFYNRLRLYFQRIPILRYAIGVYKERKEYVFDSTAFGLKYSFYSGYWQNIDYLRSQKERLKTELTYIGGIKKNEIELGQKIYDAPSIAVHVRRGDYLTGKYINDYHVQSEEYYRIAIDEMRKKDLSQKVYFFSDDIAWCRETFSDISEAVFVDSNMSSSEHIDMYLMKKADSIIISNSTFSWWAAWLAEKDEVAIIAPRKWYKDKAKNEKVKSALLEENWRII